MSGAVEYLFNAMQHEMGGRGPNEVGAAGVAEVMERYRSQGYPIIDVEVAATIPGFEYDRRYDFVTRSDSGAYVGVEVKASQVGLFRLDTKQVNFDTALLASPEGAAVPGSAYRITGVRYEGIDIGGNINARWQQGYLYWRLRASGVEPARTVAPR